MRNQHNCTTRALYLSNCMLYNNIKYVQIRSEPLSKEKEVRVLVCAFVRSIRCENPLKSVIKSVRAFIQTNKQTNRRKKRANVYKIRLIRTWSVLRFHFRLEFSCCIFPQSTSEFILSIQHASTRHHSHLFVFT